MAEFQVKVVQGGMTVAERFITAETLDELADILVMMAEDAQNGDDDWLAGAFDE